jgi:hypothetical protein
MSIATPPLIAGESTTNFSCVNKNMRIYNDLLVDGVLTIQSSGSLSVEGSAVISALTTGTLRVTSTSVVGQVTASGLDVTSSVYLSATGTGLSLNEAGSGPKQGTATLVAGTKGITNSGITASSRIFLTTQSGTPAGSIGALYIAGKSAGNSFTVASTAAADASTFAFEIFEPYV